jgi:hypothetical protein
VAAYSRSDKITLKKLTAQRQCSGEGGLGRLVRSCWGTGNLTLPYGFTADCRIPSCNRRFVPLRKGLARRLGRTPVWPNSAEM